MRNVKLLLLLFFSFHIFAQEFKNKNSTVSTSNSSVVLDSHLVTLLAKKNEKLPVSLIEYHLNTGKDVIFKADGDIRFNGKIEIKSTANASLTLLSTTNGTITFGKNASITSKAGKLDVLVQTKGSINMAASATIASNGGTIRLQAIEETGRLKRTAVSKIALMGTVNASSNTKGGKIFIESDAIQLHPSARVFAKGKRGGGAILIGGDWQGGSVAEKRETETMQQAITVTMDKGAIVDASAIENGDGGKVVLWSNLQHPSSSTEAHGTLAAKGMGSSSKGGKIETSGGVLQFENIDVSTIASDGTAGEWLLDPYNFYFNQTQLDNLASNLANNDISINTNTASSSTIGSPNSVYGSGHIVFQNNFNYNGAATRTLSLFSGGDIVINGHIKSTNGALNVQFFAPDGKRILLDYDIETRGGFVNFVNSPNVHFQKENGTQSINTAGGALTLGTSNVKLLRNNGNVVFNTGNGSLNTGTGTIEQITTRYNIGSAARMGNEWRGVHGSINGSTSNPKDYETVYVGREYSLRLYFWDSWDNESGQIFIRDGSNNIHYYFTANRNGDSFNSINTYGRSQITASAASQIFYQTWANDQYVDITFVAQHTGTLVSWNNLNEPLENESLEVNNIFETLFYENGNYTSGSRSLELITTSGQIFGSRNFNGLGSLTVNTNNDISVLDGAISGTTSFTKNGSGIITLRGAISYSGTSTVNSGSLKFSPLDANQKTLTGNFVNNSNVIYENFNSSNNSGAVALEGAISGNGTWNITSNVSPIETQKNRLIVKGNTTISGAVTVTNFGNVWFEDVNFNATSSVFLNGANTRLRLYTPNSAAIIKIGSLTGNGNVEFSNVGGAATIGLQTNTGSSNVQFDGVISNDLGKTLSFIKNGSGTFTQTKNNTFAGTTTINAGTLALQNDAPNPTNKTFTGSGSLRIEPASTSFSSAFSTSGWSFGTGLSGLILGKSGNTANITIGSATTIAGPVNVYGSTMNQNANLTTTNNGAISFYTDALTVDAARTLTAAGAFKLIPQSTSFANDITYPIANLTATSSGLTIGKSGNLKNITINQDVTGAAGIELYGGNLAINANLKTTGAGNMVLKGTSTIASGKNIESAGNFTQDGNITFKSDAIGTASFGKLGGAYIQTSGNATVERYIPAKRGWRMLTAPLKGATNNTISANWQGTNGEGVLLFSPATYQSQPMTGYTTGGSAPNIWKYDSGWKAIPNLTAETMYSATDAKPFLVFATGAVGTNNIANATGASATTLRPKGQLITGAVNRSGLATNTFYAIANPYASAISPVSLVTSNPGQKIWLLDPTLGTYGGYMAFDGSNWAPTVPTGNDLNIQSGQGFFVRSATATSFTINEAHKQTGSSNTWFAKNANEISNDTQDKIRILLYKQEEGQWKLADGILAVNYASGSNDIDEVDTYKISNFNESIMFRNNITNLAIEYRALPQAGDFQQMQMTVTTTIPYQLHVRAEQYATGNLQPFLEDTSAATLTEIPMDGTLLTVPFTGIVSNATTPDNRFRIVYQSVLSNISQSLTGVKVYPNPVSNGQLNIILKENTAITNYTITNLLGQTIQTGELTNIENLISVTTSQGIYILNINQEGKQFTTKISVK